jgi:hypothetical protein
MEAKGAINVYVCQTCGGRITTRNRDAGTTPFIVRCRSTEGCSGDMFSSFYRVDQLQAPTHEWYRPTSAGERKKLEDPGLCDHVERGGLLLRELAEVRA